MNLAKRRKVQIAADYDAAQRQFALAVGDPTSLDYRQDLRKNADSLKAELDKAIACILQIETRLGVNSAHFTKPNTSRRLIKTRLRQLQKAYKPIRYLTVKLILQTD